MPGDTMGHPGRWPCWSTSGEPFAGVPAKPRVLQLTLCVLPPPPKALPAARTEFLYPTSKENKPHAQLEASGLMCQVRASPPPSRTP